MSIANGPYVNFVSDTKGTFIRTCIFDAGAYGYIYDQSNFYTYYDDDEDGGEGCFSSTFPDTNSYCDYSTDCPPTYAGYPIVNCYDVWYATNQYVTVTNNSTDTIIVQYSAGYNDVCYTLAPTDDIYFSGYASYSVYGISPYFCVYDLGDGSIQCSLGCYGCYYDYNPPYDCICY
jgi:hypothetical protein